MPVTSRVRRVSAVVFYPMLAAVYPIVALYAVNLREMIPLQETVVPVLVALLATGLVLTMLRWVLRDWHRAAAMTTLLLILFFTYGAAWDAVRGVIGGGHITLGAIWAIIATLGFVAVRRIRPDRVASATPLLNLVLGVLLVGNLAPVAGFHFDVRSDADGGAPSESPVGATAASPDRVSDIYWIILDRYGSQQVIDEYYDHDISPFLDQLRERGFYIADRATANYLKTAPSLVSARNMEYLDGERLRERASADDDWGPLYRDLSSSFRLLEVLRPLGYRFVYLGTYWQFTASHPEADVNYVFDGVRSEFATVLTNSTMLRASEVLGDDAAPDARRERWNLTRFQWDTLRDATGVGSPKLVHAHFSLPHAPYVFRADGSFVPEDLERSRSTEANYADQVEYANAAVLEFVDELLAVDPLNPPVIIIQSEEGPWPHRFRMSETGFGWEAEATDEELHEKFGVLSAFHLPGLPGDRSEEAGLYPSISLVNQFRVILNHYLGTTFELLPDRNFIWPRQDDIYEFIDVTERVRRMVDRRE